MLRVKKYFCYQVSFLGRDSGSGIKRIKLGRHLLSESEDIHYSLGRTEVECVCCSQCIYTALVIRNGRERKEKRSNMKIACFPDSILFILGSASWIPS